MTDYLQRILELLEEWAPERESDWPKQKDSWPSGYGEDENSSVLPLKTIGFPERLERTVFGKTAEADGPGRIWTRTDEIIQVDHLERFWENREKVLNILPDAARNQEAAPGNTLEEELRIQFPAEENLNGPAQSGWAAKGDAPLLAQIQKSRRAVGNSWRRDALRVQGQVQPLEKGWERMALQEASQTQEQDAAQLVDRAFRRDARRYDGGFTLF